VRSASRSFIIISPRCSAPRLSGSPIENAERKPPTEKVVSERVVIVGASLQLLDATTGDLLFAAMLTPDAGLAAHEAAAMLAAALRDARAGTIRQQ
jgi:hypothetical protein